MKTYGNYLLAILPLTVCYLLCCHDGILTSPDSQLYLAYAKNLVEKGSLINTDGSPMTHWPPLYILGLIPALFWSGYIFWMNLVLLIIHQFIWVRIGKLWLANQLQLSFFCAILGLNTLILQAFVYQWSEPLFMVLMSFSFLAMTKYDKSPRTSHLWRYGIPLFLALLTRHAGWFFVPGLLIFGFIAFESKIRRQFLTFTLVATSGSLLWNIHKLILIDNGNALSEVIPQISLIRNSFLTFSELGYNLASRLLPQWIPAVIVLAILIWFLKTNTLQHSSSLIPLFTYLTFWIIIPAGADDIGRFLAPAIPLFFLPLMQSMGAFLKKQKLKLIFYGISYYLIVFSLLRIIRNTITWSNII